MSSHAHSRRHPRAILDFPLAVRFETEGFTALGIHLVNLGPGGCCLRMPAECLAEMAPGARLAAFRFEHEELDLPPVEAEVAYVRDGEEVLRWGYVLVGVCFLDAGAEFRRSVGDFLARHGAIPMAGVA